MITLRAARALVVVLPVMLATTSGVGQVAQSPEETIQRIREAPEFEAAMAAIERDHERLIQDVITLTEIPAPPFKEDARGAAYIEMLRALGLSDVERDEEGNVMGIRRGTDAPGGPLLAVAAHLDTVFPEGTDVTVKRDGTRLLAPGVSDDTYGLAVILALVRAMDEARIETTRDILFIGDVGEEGTGDLRGVKYLLREGKYRGRIEAFISLDGAASGANIVRGAVGSKRYRVTFKGPGGHSYSAFGLVSPAYALGNAMQKLGTVTVPESPKTTYSVGVVGGGTSVNSIPAEMWMEVDMRSSSPANLASVEATFLDMMRAAAAEENATRSTAEGPITVDLQVIGDRPSGETPEDSRLTQLAAASVRAAGMTPAFTFSSTDANVPISMGIPAITLDSGGRSDRTHALDEWVDLEKVSTLPGIGAVLATILGMAGM